jgi:hypothetical protein
MKAPAKTKGDAAVTIIKPTSREFVTFEEAGGVKPDYLQGKIITGLENFRNEDLKLPLVKLMQGISPELDQYDQLRPGYWLHTSAEYVFKGPFLVVPLYHNTRYMLFAPRENGGGVLARADDGIHWSPADTTFEVKLDAKYGGKVVKWRTARTVKESGLDQWGSSDPSNPNSQPAATEMLSYTMAFWEHPDMFPAILTFQRSSITTGKDFGTNIISKNASPHHLIYQFSSRKVANNSGQEYYTIAYTGRGYVPKHLIDEYDEMHKRFAALGIRNKDIDQVVTDVNIEMDQQPDEKPSRRAGGHPSY